MVFYFELVSQLNVLGENNITLNHFVGLHTVHYHTKSLYQHIVTFQESL